jgi:hypothetical protein
MRASALLLVGAALCACAAENRHEEEDGAVSSGADGGAGGGGDVDVGAAGPACHRWQLEGYTPGPDGRLGSSDDVLAGSRSVQEVNDANVIIRETAFESAGPDGVWDTPDDVILADTRLVDAGGGEVYFVSYDSPGGDGVWGNDDDTIAAAHWAKLDAMGRQQEDRTLYGAGTDGAWLTPDDPIGRRHTYSYGDGQQAPKLVDLEFVSPGPDGTWATDDDPVAIATRRFAEWGTFSIAPGADGVWATEDDVLDGRYEDKHDWQGWLQYVPLFGAGPDGAFFTADDEILGVGASRCEADAIDSRLMQMPGNDGQWGTDDDELAARMRITGCDDPCAAPTPSSPVEPPK